MVTLTELNGSVVPCSATLAVAAERLMTSAVPTVSSNAAEDVGATVSSVRPTDLTVLTLPAISLIVAWKVCKPSPEIPETATSAYPRDGLVTV